MRDYVTPDMEIELFDAHSDIILTSIDTGSGWDDFETQNSAF